MDERISKAFDAAQDTIKQLITIATAVVGAVVTFSGTGPSAFIDLKAVGMSALVAVILLLLSIGAGLAALMNLTGALGNLKIHSPTPYQAGIRIFATIQVIGFAAGIVVLALFAPHWQW
jgi:hypothetical protein